ncbi:MAG: phage virion morphogenesis protein [Methylophilus sp.]
MYYEIKMQDHHLMQVLKVVAAEIATPDQMLGSIGESLLRVNKDRHLNSQDPEGNDWKELAASTLTEKRKGGPLNKTGEMLQSLNYQVDKSALVIGFDGARNAQLAIWHHEGTEPYLIEPLNKKALKFGDRIVKRVNHPGLHSRQLLGFPASDQQLVAEVIEDHLLSVINNV